MKNKNLAIIGAGIQGICNALFLQKKGYVVNLFDKEEPGCSASYGNAGHFSPYASLQLNRYDILSDVPSMLTNSRGPLALKWNYIPKMSLSAYDELFDEINLEGLVENNGIMYVWENKGIKSRELEIKIRNELGIKQKILNKKEVHDLEPNIKPFYSGGVFYEYARHAKNPKKITQKLFKKFLDNGGKFKKIYIKDINFENKKPILITDNSKFKFDKLVIACGAFSKKLTDKLKEKIPLDTERGYHIHFKNYSHLVSRPVVWADRGFGVTPMEQGLRVVGTVELGGLENPLSKSRIKNLILNAKDMLNGIPDNEDHDDEWLGFRPTLPDFLPVIGQSKNYENVFYSFGHHHLGWTLGAISGKIVSKMIVGEKTNLELSPYSSSRFN